YLVSPDFLPSLARLAVRARLPLAELLRPGAGTEVLQAVLRAPSSDAAERYVAEVLLHRAEVGEDVCREGQMEQGSATEAEEARRWRELEPPVVAGLASLRDSGALGRLAVPGAVILRIATRHLRIAAGTGGACAAGEAVLRLPLTLEAVEEEQGPFADLVVREVAYSSRDNESEACSSELGTSFSQGLLSYAVRMEVLQLPLGLADDGVAPDESVDDASDPVFSEDRRNALHGLVARAGTWAEMCCQRYGSVVFVAPAHQSALAKLLVELDLTQTLAALSPRSGDARGQLSAALVAHARRLRETSSELDSSLVARALLCLAAASTSSSAHLPSGEAVLANPGPLLLLQGRDVIPPFSLAAGLLVERQREHGVVLGLGASAGDRPRTLLLTRRSLPRFRAAIGLPVEGSVLAALLIPRAAGPGGREPGEPMPSLVGVRQTEAAQGCPRSFEDEDLEDLLARQLGLRVLRVLRLGPGFESSRPERSRLCRAVAEASGPSLRAETDPVDGRTTVLVGLREEVDAAAVRLAGLSSRSVQLPLRLVWSLLGRGGAAIRQLEQDSGSEAALPALLRVDKDLQPPVLEIFGEEVAVQRAEQLLGLRHAHAELEVPREAVRRIIGRGGANIREVEAATGASLHVDAKCEPCWVEVLGDAQAVDSALALLRERVAPPVKVRVPQRLVPVIIGRGGANCRELEAQSGASLRVLSTAKGEKWEDTSFSIDAEEASAEVEVSGDGAAVGRARELLLESADWLSRGPCGWVLREVEAALPGVKLDMKWRRASGRPQVEEQSNNSEQMAAMVEGFGEQEAVDAALAAVRQRASPLLRRVEVPQQALSLLLAARGASLAAIEASVPGVRLRCRPEPRAADAFASEDCGSQESCAIVEVLADSEEQLQRAAELLAARTESHRLQVPIADCHKLTACRGFVIRAIQMNTKTLIYMPSADRCAAEAQDFLVLEVFGEASDRADAIARLKAILDAQQNSQQRSASNSPGRQADPSRASRQTGSLGSHLPSTGSRELASSRSCSQPPGLAACPQQLAHCMPPLPPLPPVLAEVAPLPPLPPVPVEVAPLVAKGEPKLPCRSEGLGSRSVQQLAYANAGMAQFVTPWRSGMSNPSPLICGKMPALSDSWWRHDKAAVPAVEAVAVAVVVAVPTVEARPDEELLAAVEDQPVPAESVPEEGVPAAELLLQDGEERQLEAGEDTVILAAAAAGVLRPLRSNLSQRLPASLVLESSAPLPLAWRLPVSLATPEKRQVPGLLLTEGEGTATASGGERSEGTTKASEGVSLPEGEGGGDEVARSLDSAWDDPPLQQQQQQQQQQQEPEDGEDTVALETAAAFLLPKDQGLSASGGPSLRLGGCLGEMPTQLVLESSASLPWAWKLPVDLATPPKRPLEQETQEEAEQPSEERVQKVRRSQDKEGSGPGTPEVEAMEVQREEASFSGRKEEVLSSGLRRALFSGQKEEVEMELNEERRKVPSWRPCRASLPAGLGATAGSLGASCSSALPEQLLASEGLKPDSLPWAWRMLPMSLDTPPNRSAERPASPAGSKRSAESVVEARRHLSFDEACEGLEAVASPATVVPGAPLACAQHLEEPVVEEPVLLGTPVRPEVENCLGVPSGRQLGAPRPGGLHRFSLPAGLLEQRQLCWRPLFGPGGRSPEMPERLLMDSSEHLPWAWKLLPAEALNSPARSQDETGQEIPDPEAHSWLQQSPRQTTDLPQELHTPSVKSLPSSWMLPPKVESPVTNMMPHRQGEEAAQTPCAVQLQQGFSSSEEPGEELSPLLQEVPEQLPPGVDVQLPSPSALLQLPLPSALPSPPCWGRGGLAADALAREVQRQMEALQPAPLLPAGVAFPRSWTQPTVIQPGMFRQSDPGAIRQEALMSGTHLPLSSGGMPPPFGRPLCRRQSGGPLAIASSCNRSRSPPSPGLASEPQRWRSLGSDSGLLLPGKPPLLTACEAAAATPSSSSSPKGSAREGLGLREEQDGGSLSPEERGGGETCKSQRPGAEQLVGSALRELARPLVAAKTLQRAPLRSRSPRRIILTDEGCPPEARQSGQHDAAQAKLYILDGLNILRKRNRPTNGFGQVPLEWEQLETACRYYTLQGHRISVFLPPLGPDQEHELERFREMFGDIFVVCQSASDDVFMINTVKLHEARRSEDLHEGGPGCFIVTNHRFQDWQRRGDVDSAFVGRHCVRFAFMLGDFIPSELH
ncbi:unnamed protein product, partial [Polarella glacialis]